MDVVPELRMKITDASARVYTTFSNSLIIHQVKTKEITTVKEVWIPGLN